MSDKPTLLPCPFCGGEAKLVDYGNGYDDPEAGPAFEFWIAECNECDFCLCGQDGEKHVAVNKWNRRADGWRPASKVPSDAREVLIAKGEWCCVGWYLNGWHAVWDKPTHWRELPPMPKEGV